MMYLHKSAVGGLLLLFLTACQTGNSPQYQQLYDQYEIAARQQFEQTFDTAEQYVSSETESADTPLVIDSAHQARQLAMRHSPRISAIFSDLGIHNAETVQQQLLENPGLELSLMRPEDGGRWQLELSLSLGLLDWLSRQQRVKLAESANIRWQMQAWQMLSDELTQVDNYWLAAVAAQEKLGIHRELYNSAKVSEDFALLLFEAGNISELELLTNQSIADQQHAQLIEAEFEVKKSLNNLVQALGFSESARVSVPEQLPAISQSNTHINELDTPQLLQLAQAHQPALLLSKYEIQQSEDALALALRQTALRDAGIDLVTERESSGEHQHGFALSFSAPLFDNGDTALSIIHGQTERLRIQQQQIALTTANRISTALDEIRSYLQQLDLLASDELPRLRRMMTLSVEEYNFMLRGTFDLLAMADLMLDARLRQVDNTHHYWMAYTTLENLLGTRIPEVTND